MGSHPNPIVLVIKPSITPLRMNCNHLVTGKSIFALVPSWDHTSITMSVIVWYRIHVKLMKCVPSQLWFLVLISKCYAKRYANCASVSILPRYNIVAILLLKMQESVSAMLTIQHLPNREKKHNKCHPFTVCNPCTYVSAISVGHHSRACLPSSHKMLL